MFKRNLPLCKKESISMICFPYHKHILEQLLQNLLLQSYSVFIRSHMTIEFTLNQNIQLMVHLETPIHV